MSEGSKGVSNDVDRFRYCWSLAYVGLGGKNVLINSRWVLGLCGVVCTPIGVRTLCIDFLH